MLLERRKALICQVSISAAKFVPSPYLAFRQVRVAGYDVRIETH